MDDRKISIVYSTAIKIAAITALLIATTNQQYSYYIFLRWLIMPIFIYFGYKAYKANQAGLLILFGTISIIYNPIHKIWLYRKTWCLVDYIVILITLITIGYDWNSISKESNRSELHKR